MPEAQTAISAFVEHFFISSARETAAFTEYVREESDHIAAGDFAHWQEAYIARPACRYVIILILIGELTVFKRIANLFKGFIGMFVSGMERKNPEALLEVEKENLRAEIAKYNQGLASHAALCERLATQIKKGESG